MKMDAEKTYTNLKGCFDSGVVPNDRMMPFVKQAYELFKEAGFEVGLENADACIIKHDLASAIDFNKVIHDLHLFVTDKWRA